MGGTVGYLVNLGAIGTSATTRVQERFTQIYWFVVNTLVAAGQATIIASQRGSGGLGFGYWDEANPSGENAFFVFRMNTSAARPGGGAAMGAYYVLVQWADAASFGNAPGNPGKMNNATVIDGVGICVAFREDGTSPWAGTTNADGTDTKGTPVWTAGGSTLHVLERSCSPGGANAVNKENTLQIYDSVDGPGVMHIVYDDDTIIFLCRFDISSGSYDITYIGLYTLASGITCSYPMVVMRTDVPFDSTTVWGTLNGSTLFEGALVSSNFTGRQDCMFMSGFPGTRMFDTAYQPNKMAEYTGYDEVTFPLIAYDTNLGNYGLCGELELIRVTCLVSSESISGDGQRAVFCTSAPEEAEITIPWADLPAPGDSLSRAGVQG